MTREIVVSDNTQTQTYTFNVKPARKGVEMSFKTKSPLWYVCAVWSELSIFADRIIKYCRTDGLRGIDERSGEGTIIMVLSPSQNGIYCMSKQFAHSISNSFLIEYITKHTYIILTPLNHTFIKQNWVLQGYSLIFLFLLKYIDCGYSLEPPRRGEAVLTSTHNLCFEQKYETITKTRLFKYIENFTSKNWKFSDKKFWYFFYFCSKHRLWVLVRTASVLTSTHNL